MKILVADGSRVIVDRLASALIDISGVETVSRALDAEAAVSSIQAFQHDLVIVDPHIAANGAIEFLKSAKRLRPEMIIVAFTNLYCHANGRRCLGAGADFFLDKSGEPDEVLDIVRRNRKVSFG